MWWPPRPDSQKVAWANSCIDKVPCEIMKQLYCCATDSHRKALFWGIVIKGSPYLMQPWSWDWSTGPIPFLDDPSSIYGIRDLLLLQMKWVPVENSKWNAYYCTLALSAIYEKVLKMTASSFKTWRSKINKMVVNKQFGTSFMSFVNMYRHGSRTVKTGFIDFTSLLRGTIRFQLFLYHCKGIFSSSQFIKLVYLEYLIQYIDIFSVTT